MNNYEVKEMMKKSRFFQYEIASAMYMNEESLSRWFRKPLTEQQIERITNAIKKLKEND